MWERNSIRSGLDPTRLLKKENDIKCYPEKDYHEMYMLEIVRILQKEE